MTVKKKIFILLISSILFSTIILIIISNYNHLDVDNNNVPCSSNVSYFPDKTFPRITTNGYLSKENKVETEEIIIKNEYDTIIKNYISKSLHKFKEPLLYNCDKEKEIYRFTWLRSFDNPIVIRIEISSNKKTIFWKELEIDKEYKPTKIIIDENKPLSSQKWNELNRLIQKMNFWEINPNINAPGFDGSFWVLEGTKEGKYKAVAYWVPKRKQIEYFKLCIHILSLTDLKIEENNIY